MQTTNSNKLSCAVFGHNLERSSKMTTQTQQLQCKTSKSLVSIDSQGEFNTVPLKNQNMALAFKQLFVMNSQYYRGQLTVQ